MFYCNNSAFTIATYDIIIVIDDVKAAIDDIKHIMLSHRNTSCRGRSRISRKGGMDLQRGHILVKMYMKMKELGPVGGSMHQKILHVDPPMSCYGIMTSHFKMSAKTKDFCVTSKRLNIVEFDKEIAVQQLCKYN